jgi:glycosyltransferase involved in cell wall biosynthesis
MVLLGDGPLRPALQSQIEAFKLQDHIQLPGFRQYPELPSYYALAGAFIHASTIEQWGLVVNEAMASGLPVIVSNRCGCARDLVKEGLNGFTFDPFNADALAQLMSRVARLDEEGKAKMGAESRRIIAEWGVKRFADGLESAVAKALEVGPPRVSLFDRGLLHALMLR